MSVNCHSLSSEVHLRDRAATLDKPGDTVTWLYKVSLCYNGRHVWPSDGSQLRTQECSHGFYSFKMRCSILLLSVASISGFYGHFHVFAKAQTVAIINEFVQALNLLYKTWAYMGPQVSVHLEMTQMSPARCCPPPTSTPALGRQSRRILSSRPVWDTDWDLPSSSVQVGVRLTKHLQSEPELHVQNRQRWGRSIQYSNTSRHYLNILTFSVFSIAFHQPQKRGLLGDRPS